MIETTSAVVDMMVEGVVVMSIVMVVVLLLALSVDYFNNW